MHASSARSAESGSRHRSVPLGRCHYRRALGTPVALLTLLACGSAGAVTCTVSGFEPHDNLRVSGGTATISPGSNTVYVPISSSTERCAQIRIRCEGYGSALVDPEDFTARFADGNERQGREDFETERVHDDESRTFFTCFGTSRAPIVEIRGKL